MLLQINNIKKKFSTPNGPLSILKGVQFTVNEGEKVALVGRSGSGKSTLLSLIAGLDFPTEGTIVFRGTDFSKESLESLAKIRARYLGIVYQQFHLIPHLTAIENVALPREINGQDNSYEQAKLMLTKVGLEDRFTAYPATLSGGEKQRVAIARALVHGPSLLLLDEPTGSLDLDTGEKVMDLVFRLVEELKMAMILVTHGPELAKRCQKTLTLQHGLLGQ